VTVNRAYESNDTNRETKDVDIDKLLFAANSNTKLLIIYVRKLFGLYRLQSKGDVVVVDIIQHKSQFNNYSNLIITQSAKFDPPYILNSLIFSNQNLHR